MYKSILEVMVEIMHKKKKPQNYLALYDEVAKKMKFDEETKERNISKFYSDLSLSALFVYIGDNTWDLKENQSINMWDKDASFFVDPEKLKKHRAERLAKKKTKAPKVIDDTELEDDVEETELKEYESDLLATNVEDEKEPEVDFSHELDESDNQDSSDDDFASKEELSELTATDESEETLSEEEYNDYMEDYENLYDKDN